MKQACWGGVLWDFSPSATELCSDGKESRTWQLDGSKEAAGEMPVSEGNPLGHPHITSSGWSKITVWLTTR